jgi:hypothetical protein
LRPAQRVDIEGLESGDGLGDKGFAVGVVGGVNGLFVGVEEVRVVDVVDSERVDWFARRVTQELAAFLGAIAMEGEEGH